MYGISWVENVDNRYPLPIKMGKIADDISWHAIV